MCWLWHLIQECIFIPPKTPPISPIKAARLKTNIRPTLVGDYPYGAIDICITTEPFVSVLFCGALPYASFLTAASDSYFKPFLPCPFDVLFDV